MESLMSMVGLWVTPLLLLPGVALLVMSTSLRYNRLHDEVHALDELHAHGGGDEAANEQHLACLLQRGRHFRNALIALYLAVVCFALGALTGGLLALWPRHGMLAILALSGVGIAAVLAAAVLLVRESLLSFEVLEDHARHLMG